MIRLLSTAMLAITAIGCVRVEHPLSEVGEVILDDAVVGTWQLQDPVFGPSEDMVEITALNDELYRWSNGGDKYHEFRIVRAAGSNYIEVVRCVRDGAIDEMLASILSFPMRWERRGEWMKLEHQSGVEAFIGEGKELRGIVDPSLRSSGTITSTAAELEAFLRKHADNVFCQQSIYRKSIGEPKDSSP